MVATSVGYLCEQILASFSPLFIGAMVATILMMDLTNGVVAFSPLFIGAMVATADER